MTDFSELLESGRLKRGRFSEKQVSNSLRLAERDLKVAAEAAS